VNSFDGINIHINGTEIPLINTDISAPILIKVTPVNDLEMQSINHPNALMKCEKWIIWRKNRFENKQLRRSNRRYKSDVEVQEELKNSIVILNGILERIKQGEIVHLGYLSAILRALLFWNSSKNYSPLLLRLANKKNLPLPLFALPAKENNIPDFFKNAKWIRMNIPTIRKNELAQEIIDLQEWLEQEFIVKPNAISESQKTNKEMIAQYANTMGGTHYDESVPNDIVIMKEYIVSQNNIFSSFLIQTGEVILALSKYVNEQLKKKE